MSVNSILKIATAATTDGMYIAAEKWAGGDGLLLLSGTPDGSTLTLEVQYPNTSTWLAIPDAAFTDLTATPARVRGLPFGTSIAVSISDEGVSTSWNALLMRS